jgi:hypothetical protein
MSLILVSKPLRERRTEGRPTMRRESAAQESRSTQPGEIREIRESNPWEELKVSTQKVEEEPTGRSRWSGSSTVVKNRRGINSVVHLSMAISLYILLSRRIERTVAAGERSFKRVEKRERQRKKKKTKKNLKKN